MSGGWNWIFFVTLALIGASVVDDLRSRKVHNRLVLSTFVVAILAQLLAVGLAALPTILISFVGAFAFCLPLYLLRAVGGGDVKLIMALSPLMTWADVGWMVVFSLFWGSIFGLIMIFLRGEAASLARNLTSLALRNPVERSSLHKLPYTIAILFGFLTQHSLVSKGVSLL